MAKICLTMPLYDGTLHIGAANGFFEFPSQQHEVYRITSSGSLISLNCNTLLIETLNKQALRGYELFAMLHSDIEPEKYWLDTLVNELYASGADFISAVVPVKWGNGTTSTAIAHPDSLTSVSCYITQSQINHPSFPVTFGIDECVSALAELPIGLRVAAPKTALLCNTGCMVCRLDRPWFQSRPPSVWFDERNAIASNEKNMCSRTSISEDQFFSLAITQQGGKVVATKAIKLTHWGTFGYKSDQTWGLPTAST
jgi:hypothetical protein